MKVLIVDDDPMLLTVMSRTISRWGYETAVAPDGATAIELLRQPQPPRIVLLDLMMPGINGMDACRQIAANAHSLIYTIILTAVGTQDMLVKSLEAGAHDFLSKPVEMAELKCRLAVGQRLVEAEDAARQNTAILEAAAEGADLGIWELNQKTGIVRILRLPSILNFPSDRITINDWLALVHPEDLPRVRARIEAGQSSLQTTYRIRASGGQWRWVQLLGRNVGKDESGQPLRVCGCLQDITDQVEQETRMVEAERFSAVAALAAGVAHNFNNLNTGVCGNLQLALRKEELLTPPLREQLQRALDASQKITEITQALLRVSSANPTSPVTPLPLRKLLEDLLLLVSESFAADGIRLETDLDGAPAVPCDPAALAQAVFNLLDNARHAVAEKDLRIISVACRKNGEMAEIVVRDNGCGIEHDRLKRIFSPFYTTKGEHAEKGSYLANFRGMGIGLYMVRNIVNWHQGEITVKSSRGEGSIFTITLPLTRPAAALPEAPAPAQT